MSRTFVLMAVALITLTACNTVAGVGRDIEAAGKAVQRSTR